VESNRLYYARRAAEERRRAASAVTPQARQRHDELADLFASKAHKNSEYEHAHG